MFTFFSKFLPLFVYPIGLTSLLILFGLTLWKKRRLALALFVVAFGVIFITGNKYVALSLARSLEWRYLPSKDPRPAQVIVLLGGATEPALPPRSGVELNSAADRLLHAAVLYKDGMADHILLSGGNIDFLSSTSATPASDMDSLMQLLGVPETALWQQGKSENTYEDALYSCQMLREKNISSIILVTSAMHMPRAVAVFLKQGCPVRAEPADYVVTEAAWAELWNPNWQQVLLNLLPNESNISLTTNALKEYIGLLVYHLKGWA